MRRILYLLSSNFFVITGRLDLLTRSYLLAGLTVTERSSGAQLTSTKLNFSSLLFKHEFERFEGSSSVAHITEWLVLGKST